MKNKFKQIGKDITVELSGDSICLNFHHPKYNHIEHYGYLTIDEYNALVQWVESEKILKKITKI